MNPGVQMPKYKCHKEVWALKIADIKYLQDGSGIIVPADEGYGHMPVDNAYLNKHQPKPGGYYVVYEDGYKSFSPAKAFEEGYRRV